MGVVFSDDLSSFSDLIREKLTNDASIYLNGCDTARENWPYASDNNHITKYLSQELQGIRVKGNRGKSLTNDISNPFNRNQSVRVGREFHSIGFTRIYVNGRLQ